MRVRKGTIVALRGTWGSGLAELVIDEQVGDEVKRVAVTCENAQTVRSLDACFGKVIGNGHTIDNREGGHLGKEIYFSVGDFDVLEAFTPVDDAPTGVGADLRGGNSMTIEAHEIANLFPLLGGKEFEEFKEDIRKNGLKVPITIYEGKILDGRNRHRACVEVGVPPVFIAYEGSDPVGHSWSLNYTLRHLNQSQKALARVRAGEWRASRGGGSEQTAFNAVCLSTRDGKGTRCRPPHTSVRRNGGRQGDTRTDRRSRGRKDFRRDDGEDHQREAQAHYQG